MHHSEYVSESEKFYCHRSEQSDDSNEESVSEYDDGNLLESTEPGKEEMNVSDDDNDVDMTENKVDAAESNHNNRTEVTLHFPHTNSYVSVFLLPLRMKTMRLKPF